MCPACGSEDRIVGRGVHEWCGVCGHRWLVTSLEEHAVTEEVYNDTYAGYREDPIFQERLQQFFENQLAPAIPADARVLDVGCGGGEAMLVMQRLGYDVRGIDISGSSARLCNKRGLNAIAGDFLTHEFDTRFDLITMWDVAEHLLDPVAFMSRARVLLKPGARLMIKVPGFGDLSVRLSGAVPRVSSKLLGTPRHVQFFCPQSLEAALHRAGFTAEWLPRPKGGLRGRRSGGKLKRRIARRAARAIKHLSGDINFYVAARPALA